MKNHLLSYAEYLKISPQKFYELGVLNPIVNKDIRLFIDPRLLKRSRYEIFNKDAVKTYDDFYKNLAGDIKAYLKIQDENIKTKAKRNIINKLIAKEPIGLGLGYSRQGTSGQGVGSFNADVLFRNALDIYKCVPDIGEKAFSLLNLLSEGIGADYIGDITANIILEELYKFTEDITQKLNIQTEQFFIKDNVFMLPKYPNSRGNKIYPILLVPRDILSDLPKDIDFENVLQGYSNKNEQIRTDVNEKILNILKEEHINKPEKKAQIFEIFKNDSELITLLSHHMSTMEGNKYNFEKDSKGILIRDRLLNYLKISDLKIDTDDNLEIINYIINRFEKFVENNNKLKRELLWESAGKYKPESAWQQLFHTYIAEFLHLNNIDISQENETGSGPVDFSFSQGSRLRVLIELKLSVNSPNKGLVKQLEKYRECTDNVKATYFICINVHKEKQTQQILSELNKEKERIGLNTKIIVIDGKINPSASNLRLF